MLERNLGKDPASVAKQFNTRTTYINTRQSKCKKKNTTMSVSFPHPTPRRRTKAPEATQLQFTSFCVDWQYPQEGKIWVFPLGGSSRHIECFSNGGGGGLAYATENKMRCREVGWVSGIMYKAAPKYGIAWLLMCRPNLYSELRWLHRKMHSYTHSGTHAKTEGGMNTIALCSGLVLFFFFFFKFKRPFVERKNKIKLQFPSSGQPTT